MGLEVEQIDTPSAPETLLRELADYYDVIEAEDLPGDPPTPVEMRIAEWRNASEHYPEFRWILRDDEGIAAAAVAAYDTTQNLENGFWRLYVRPDRRGRGYARALAASVFDHLEAAGRQRIATLIKKDTPPERLATRVGLKPVYEEKRSRLVIADLDMGLMRSWIEHGSERAADYELVYYESPIPADIVQKFCDLAFIMNTAPREDFEEDDEVVTPDYWRELESNVANAKGQLHNLIAVHRPSGDFVGYTQINTLQLQPDLAWQWDTGVDPSHRNKGLGRWLKAALIERVLAAGFSIERVDTFNAGSNEPMLKINAEMGFKPVHIANAWQGDLSTVRERFGA